MTQQLPQSVDDLLEIWAERGGSQYGGEAVTQLEHALQTACLAEIAGANSSLITAALLHDFGHLVHQLPNDAPDQGIDDHHENLGQRWLTRMYPQTVTEPIRLHVAAKRYLCRVDPEYLSRLSGPSMVSLELQGGPMDDQEAAAFEANPHGEDAVRLRRWDDAAKIPDLAVPPLEHYRNHLQAALSQEFHEKL